MIFHFVDEHLTAILFVLDFLRSLNFSIYISRNREKNKRNILLRNRIHGKIVVIYMF